MERITGARLAEASSDLPEGKSCLGNQRGDGRGLRTGPSFKLYG